MSILIRSPVAKVMATGIAVVSALTPAVTFAGDVWLECVGTRTTFDEVGRAKDSQSYDVVYVFDASKGSFYWYNQATLTLDTIEAKIDSEKIAWEHPDTGGPWGRGSLDRRTLIMVYSQFQGSHNRSPGDLGAQVDANCTRV